MVNFSKNIYISTKHSINHLPACWNVQPKHNDGLSYYDRDVDSKIFLKQRKILRMKGILKN